jgi:uncharacterized protein YegL
VPYHLTANADQPAFIVYLIDLSGSMEENCGSVRRIDVVAKALERTRRKMIARSRRGDDVRPRYAVSMLGYSTTVTDLLKGVKTIDELEVMKMPELHPQGSTNTGAAFQAAHKLLLQHLPKIQDCPAPLVCHLTDGVANVGDRSTEIAEEIKKLTTSDGHVLVENIYIGDQLLNQPIAEPKKWPGVLKAEELQNEHALKLWQMASPLPASYAAEMSESEGYSMQAGAKMLIPAEVPEMIELAFAMSSATGTGMA